MTTQTELNRLAQIIKPDSQDEYQRKPEPKEHRIRYTSIKEREERIAKRRAAINNSKKITSLFNRASAPKKRWEPTDDITLRKFYESTSMEDMAAMLCRTETAIRLRAAKLGLQKRPRYSQDEIDFIEANFHTMPMSEIAQHLKRDFYAVRQKAWTMGLRKR